jgi:Tfp pilus assembly protein PilX
MKGSRRYETHDIPDHAQGGFALSVVLLALLALTAMATAGYLRSNTDYRINQNHRASLKAFYVADAARSHYLGRGKLRTDTVTYTYGEGSADVWAAPLLEVDDSTSLYRLVSSGSHRPPEGGVANRVTSSILIHKAAGVSVKAAITSPPGLNKSGVSGTVDGNDGASATDCPVGATENLAGLEVPPGGFSQNGGGSVTSSGEGKGVTSPAGFAGNPGIDSTQVATQMLADLGINWTGLLDGSFAQADYTVSTDGYPNFSSDVATDEWPLILIDSGDYAVGPTQSGRGTLVFTGDATISGSFTWEGLILIGGELISNGNNRVEGSVITGLNILLGDSPGPSDLGHGTSLYQYHSCNVLNALKGVGWPVEEPGTWHEVF